MLRFAGGFAEIVGVNASIHSGEIDQAAAQDGTPDRIDEKFGWVHDGAGDRYDDIEFNAWLAAAEITDDREGVGALLGELFGVEPEVGLASPLALVGSVDQVIEELEHRRAPLGLLVPRSSRATRPGTSPPSWPASPAPDLPFDRKPAGRRQTASIRQMRPRRRSTPTRHAP